MAIFKKSKKDNKTSQDDALFVALGKSKKRKKRKIIITVVSIILVLAIAAIITVNNLQRKVREQFASTTGEVKSYAAQTGSISTVVSGSGTLTDIDLQYIKVPYGVKITEVLVNTNDSIEEGDVIATVNMDSVMSSLVEIQSDIESLDEQLSEAEGDEASTTIYAGVTGRVKAIFAQEDADVTSVMCDDGALALLSIDGYMAVDVETDALAVGNSVTVRLSSGEEIAGAVENISQGKATIIITDDGPEYDDEVTVLSDSGSIIGTGKLYIHNALRITGYAGTIESVKVSLNDEVKSTTKIFTLEDTGYSANYYTLLRERNEKEETLIELLAIQRNGAVVAPVSGSVSSVDYVEEDTSTTTSIMGQTTEGKDPISIATLSKDEKMSVTVNVDESDILTLELGQEVTVSVSSVSEDSYVGTLTEINRTSSSSGTYSAVIELDKADGMLAGMTASVSVQIEGVDNAILIPVEAIHKTSDGAYVYTVYDEENNEYGGKVDVITGLENSTYIEIKSGLNVGDKVYYTETTNEFAGFGGGNMPDMSGFDGSNMPNMGGGNFPSGGGGSFPGGGSGGFSGGKGNFPG